MKFELLQPSLPPDMAGLVSGYLWQPIHVGLSTAQVFRLEAENREPLYLKIAKRAFAHSLLPEKQRLDWLKIRLPVPEVLLFAENESSDYLLLSAIPGGVDASDDSFKGNERGVIEQLANGLKMIHSLPIEDCPFEARLNYKIELAEKMLVNNLVDESDFDAGRQGRTAEDLFQELTESKPDNEDLVFTHGDFCLPNIIAGDGMLGGFVDWGNAGVADKYQDIALLARSVRYNFGAQWTQILFETLGIEPDMQKIDFYQLLDEFF